VSRYNGRPFPLWTRPRNADSPLLASASDAYVVRKGRYVIHRADRARRNYPSDPGTRAHGTNMRVNARLHSTGIDSCRRCNSSTCTDPLSTRKRMLCITLRRVEKTGNGFFRSRKICDTPILSIRRTTSIHRSPDSSVYFDFFLLFSSLYFNWREFYFNQNRNFISLAT